MQHKNEENDLFDPFTMKPSPEYFTFIYDDRNVLMREVL